MITLEQIKLLEQKVEAALQKIVELQHENNTLKQKNEDLLVEIELIQEQSEKNKIEEVGIEKKILSILDKLNNVEDTVRQTQSETTIELPSTTASVENNVNLETHQNTPKKNESVFGNTTSTYHHEINESLDIF